MTIGSATQEASGEKKKYDPLPDGNYLVAMDRVSEEATKAGTGSFVKSSFKVLEGDYKDRLIFHNFLITHTNPKAASIGKEQLSKCLKAIGVSGGFDALGNDTSQLEGFLGKELIVNVGTENNATYGARNKVKKWVRK